MSFAPKVLSVAMPSAEAVEELRSMLGAEANAMPSIMGRLEAAAWMCVEQEKGRRANRDFRKARERLVEIEQAAKALSRLLGREPDAARLLGALFAFEVQDEDGAIDLSASRERREEELVAFRRRLEAVVSVAGRDLGNETSHRAALRVPPSRGKDPPRALLWPLVFDILDECGHRVAATAGGPTYRFVAAVHDAFGLEEPAAGTVSGAVNEWRRARQAVKPI